MLSWNTLEKTNKITLIIFVISTVVSLSFNVYQCNTNAENKAHLDSLNYALTSFQFAPRIRIAEPPKISCSFRIEAAHLSADRRSRMFQLGLESVAPILKITNENDNQASVLAYFAKSSLDDTDVLREKLSSLARGMPDTNWMLYIERKMIDIFRKDTNTLEFGKLAIRKGKRFTLHFLILYENGLERMYDTYCWARFQVDDQTKTLLAESESHVRLIDWNQTVKQYSFSERSALHRFLINR